MQIEILSCRKCGSRARIGRTSPDPYVVGREAFALLSARGGTCSWVFGDRMPSLEYLQCCGVVVRRVVVRGVYRASHKCDARCEASHGGKCECSCGGRNHGIAYSAA